MPDLQLLDVTVDQMCAEELTRATLRIYQARHAKLEAEALLRAAEADYAEAIVTFKRDVCERNGLDFDLADGRK